MKKLKLSEARIVALLKEAESGTAVEDICRSYEISASTFYTLKARYSGMDVCELKKLKETEAELSRLKRMYADVCLQNEALKEIVAKKL